MDMIVLVESHGPKGLFWTNLEKYKRIPEMSVSEVLKKYQGFEGELKELWYLKENDPDLKSVYDLFVETASANDSKLLYVRSISDSNCIEPIIPSTKVGYDVGACNDECIFSSIINEVIFGHLQELIIFKNSLNENFLFPDKKTAENYIQMHDEMSAQGKGVEDYMPMIIYEIWKLK